MKLDDTQRKKVSEWIAAGAKLSEIQNRLASELGISMTYIDVRFLVDDLKLMPRDQEPPKTPTLPLPASAPATTTGANPAAPADSAQPAPASGGVSISVDQRARPGTVVSGNVTFTDGNKADWYIDQTGRLGLAPQIAGYRPQPGDVQQFQTKLESELSRLGFA